MSPPGSGQVRSRLTRHRPNICLEQAQNVYLCIVDETEKIIKARKAATNPTG